MPDRDFEREARELFIVNGIPRRRAEATQLIAARLRADAERIAELERDLRHAQEATQALSDGKPLGPVVGAQIIFNQQERIRQLEAQLAEAREDSATLERAARWCLDDGSYKAPEEWNVHMRRWADCLGRAIDENAARRGEKG